MIKNIAIICGYPFPVGLAPSTRILTLAKGLKENGVNVDIFIYFPTDSQSSQLPVEGEISGIRYIYPDTRVYKNNIFLRKLSHIYYLIITLKKYQKYYSANNYQVSIISSDWFRILFTFVPFLNLFNTKIIFIADEFPYPIRVKLKNEISKWRINLFKFILNFVDGMVLMTNELRVFYESLVKKPFHLLPSIIDLSRFTEIIDSNVPESKYICYMGNMELAKDNIDNIIIAFNLIKSKYPDINLYLYGAPNKADFNFINSLIKNYNLTERVIFKGTVSNDKVNKILRESILLVSSQPNTMRAKGGFPTKLGEYMATGIPMLVTDVGEISKIIKHGENGWLAIPNDPLDFSRKMEYILDNYGYALKVALNGQNFVRNAFNSTKIANDLLQFFNIYCKKYE